MRAFFQLAFLALLASTFAGCFDNRPISRVDSGPVVVPMDGGTDPGRDTGPIILQDSGPGCVPESSASACTDFADNDCDGQIDCNDISCCSLVSCATGTLCGNMRVDAGVDSGPTSCPGVTFPSTLSSGCLPRCSSSTLTTANACPDADCFWTTLDADPTPSVNTTLNGMARVIDCSSCVSYQYTTCMYDYCPSQYTTWASCLGMTSDPADCDVEATALDSCLDASAGYGDCAGTEGRRCFP